MSSGRLLSLSSCSSSSADERLSCSSSWFEEMPSCESGRSSRGLADERGEAASVAGAPSARVSRRRRRWAHLMLRRGCKVGPRFKGPSPAREKSHQPKEKAGPYKIRTCGSKLDGQSKSLSSRTLINRVRPYLTQAK